MVGKMGKNWQVKRPWLKSYDSHVPETIRYPEITIDQLFNLAEEKYARKTFLVYKEFSYSYKRISKYVNNLKDFLILMGLKKGDQVAVVLPNIPEFVVAYFGVLAAGGIVVAMNPRYTEDEFKQLFNKVNVQMVICLDSHTHVFQQMQKEFLFSKILFSSHNTIGNLNIQSKSDQKSNHNKMDLREIINDDHEIAKEKVAHNFPDDAAIFQFSGGTTGYPKAAIGMHKNIVANAFQFSRWCDLTEGRETILAAIPLYHVYGMVLALNMGVAIGAQIILVDDPSNIDFVLSQIESHQVTFYPGVPTMYNAINKNPKVKKKEYDLTSIKACISGSFTLHPHIKKDFEAITQGKLIEGYGLSEAPTATHCNPLYGENRVGSIGLPLPDVNAKIVDIETGQKEMEIGQIGELIIHGPQVMQGYFQQEQETRISLRDGWLYTGDIAKMDVEGYFYLVDRKKSLIKVNGLQVWPNEVEKIIDSHPDVIESGVGGVPDKECGERVICWLVLKPGTSISTDKMNEWCRSKISAYKIPVEYMQIEKLPRTGVGKILRRELISSYLENAGQ